VRSQTTRLYLATVTLLVFFVLWTAIASHPWAAPVRSAVDPRLAALAAREARLQREAAQVRRLIAERWQAYARRLRVRQRQIAAARLRHERLLAAARAATLRVAAAEAARAQAPVYAAAPSSAGAPAPRVVTLPPQVQIVHLAPVTATSSSRP